MYQLNDSLGINTLDLSVNVSVGEKKDKMMMTGMHTVANIFCVGWGSIETAHEKNQKYKEGKSVLERSLHKHKVIKK
ncbi:hypothetical protein RJ641_005560 [Dillenia turbinata]|uniref:Yippee domain-containing protein n=1 Tax=Dillenia turbinata TaxID=194707 RepID=A0AAN8ZBV2_9MAGN